MICVKFFLVLLFALGSTGQESLAVRRSRQTYEGVTCTLPEHPPNGQWRLLNSNNKPGDTIPFGTVLQFSCDEGYKLKGKTSFVVCTKDFNPYSLPQCAKMCPPMFSTATTTFKCVDENDEEIDCTEATDGSYLTYTCLPFYEPPIGYRRNILCLDGFWNYPKPVCQPLCGKKIASDNVPLINNGIITKTIEYPWIAAIFRKSNSDFVNVCGGSLISKRVILTAAHCVTDMNGNPLPIEDFRVGLGKYYRAYKEPRDDQAQYHEATRIITRRGYKGPQRNYIEDISLIVTKQSVTLSPVVQPVCINDINNFHLHVGYTGEIAGWGITEDGVASEVLRKLAIPYKDQSQCAEELNRMDDFAEKYNMIDKMCAGFYNQNVSVCRGDSGSGLVFRNPVDNRYYIHGLVSIGPAVKGQCSVNQNTLYTKVAFYYEFIDREITKNHREDCKLPPYPQNGFWSIETDKNKFPGDVASSSTTLKFYCKSGYKLDGDELITCDSIGNIPSCEVQCESLSFPPESKVTCLNSRRRRIDCKDATDGSFVQYQCLAQDGQYGPQSFRQCVGGTWGSPAPTCVSVLPSTTHRAVVPTPVGAVFGIPTDGAEYSGQKVFCIYDSSYFPKDVLPEDVDTTLCTHLIASFAAEWDGNNATDLFSRLPRFVDNGASKGLFRRSTDLKKLNPHMKVLMRITGIKTKGDPYSVVSASNENTEGFIDKALEVLHTYDFDGIVIDWHNPGVYEKNNYIRLIKIGYKKSKEKGYLFTPSIASVLDNTGYDANVINDNSDFVVIKSYDYFGQWSKHTGQNSALYPSSQDTQWERTKLNFNASFTNWVNGGISKEKIIMSIPFQTRTFKLTDPNKHDVHSPFNGTGPGKDGILRLSDICKDYQEYTDVWDNEQLNPYRYKDDNWFGYENENSIWLKANFVKEQNLAGVNIWPINGDDLFGKCKDKHRYLKSVLKGLGFKEDALTGKFVKV